MLTHDAAGTRPNSLARRTGEDREAHSNSCSLDRPIIGCGMKDDGSLDVLEKVAQDLGGDRNSSQPLG